MKKKLLSLTLSILLALSLCAPAFAEDTDQVLSRVTQAVKKTLSIGDFDNFSGTPTDLGPVRYWALNWTNDDGTSINVTATDTGKIMEYSADETTYDYSGEGSYVPRLSKVNTATAKTTAQSFLNRVLTGTEKGEMIYDTNTTSPGSDYYYSARILLNGVPSSDNAQVRVSTATGAVTYYQRDDAYSVHINDVPSATPAVTAATASEALLKATSLSLQYVSGDDGTAVLRYVPTINANLYVDAQTGKVMDLSDAWDKVDYSGNYAGKGSGGSASDAESSSLSPAEQSAIAAMVGVRSKESLDAAIRQISALGLSRYKLSSVTYSLDEETKDVSCEMVYARPLAYSELTGVNRADYSEGQYQQSKILTVNAKTGALLEGWSYCPECMKDGTTSRSTMQPKAESFLKYWQPDLAGQTALVDGEGGYFSFARKVNGYLFSDDSIDVEIDPTDGSVEGFHCCWEKDLKFESTDGVISQSAAQSALDAVLKTELCYINYPVSVNTSIPIWSTYESYCGSVAYRYILGYTYAQGQDDIQGVDAKSGKVIRSTDASTAADYTDLSGSYAKKQIEELAANGVRFSASEEFQPTAKLTQQDLLVLLLNSCGWGYDAEDLDDTSIQSDLYESAWSVGFLPRGQKNPTAAVTRLGLIKMIISASPYGKAAKLSKIFKTSFSDASQIPTADLGYAAVAEGLGLVRGNAKHQLLPGRTATRQDAAAILYNYMNR
jgi:hypothetical protein